MKPDTSFLGTRQHLNSVKVMLSIKLGSYILFAHHKLGVSVLEKSNVTL